MVKAIVVIIAIFFGINSPAGESISDEPKISSEQQPSQQAQSENQATTQADVPQIQCNHCTPATGPRQQLDPLVIDYSRMILEGPDYPAGKRPNAAHAVRDAMRAIRNKLNQDNEYFNAKPQSAQPEPTIQERLKSKMEKETGGFSGKIKPGKKGIEIRYKKEWD